MLYNFGYKLDEIRSIFSTLQFTTLILYTVQCTIECTEVLYILLYICTLAVARLSTVVGQRVAIENFKKFAKIIENIQ